MSEFIEVPVSSYCDRATVDQIRKELVENRYQSSDGKQDGESYPEIQSISLPWWVWDDIFQALRYSRNRQHAALASFMYPEGGPLDDVKDRIMGPDFTNAITLAESK